jgi:hypothetical protein
VDTLVELVHGGIRVEVRPDGLRHLLAMETMAGRQGDQLQQALGPAPLPGLVEDHARTGSQGELAQELEVCQSRHDDKRTPRSLVHDTRGFVVVRARSNPSGRAIAGKLRNGPEAGRSFYSVKVQSSTEQVVAPA